MTPSEVADLLSLSVELDRYMTADKATKEKVIAWTAVLNAQAPTMTFEEGQRLVIDYYGTEGESLTVYALIELWKRANRLLPSQIAADVRVAKRLGLVPGSWPATAPLESEAATKLAEYRAGVNAGLPELEHTAGASPLALDVGRRV